PMPSFTNRIAAGIVKQLSENGIDMKTHRKAPDLTEIDGKKIEEQRTFGLSSQGDHLPLVLRIRDLVDVLQVRSLAAQSRPIIDQFAIYLAGDVINESQWIPLPYPSVFKRLASKKLVNVFVRKIEWRRAV